MTERSSSASLSSASLSTASGVAFYVLLIAVTIGSVAAGVLWVSRRKAVTAAP